MMAEFIPVPPMADVNLLNECSQYLVPYLDGPVVYGVVQSQSGISEWNFKLDFNDYGHITGTYWLSSDNDDSNIPERFGDLIRSAINNYSSEDDEEEGDEPEYEFIRKGYCPYCGKKKSVSNAIFCSYCGKRLG